MNVCLSVIIVSYNVEAFLVSCLESLFRHSKDLKIEVFVVDNHSTDNTARHVSEKFPEIRLIRNSANVGFAKACNQAIALARGRYILLLNPDTIIAENVFEKMIRFLDQQPKIGVLGPRLLNSDGSPQGSARRFPNLWTAFFGRSSVFTRLFPENPISRANLPGLKQEIKEPFEVDWVSGAAMMVRSKALEQVGLLDEDFFLFWEDADWCYRMKANGWRVFYFPEVRVVHHIGRSVASLRTTSIIEFHRSAYRWYRKHNVTGPWSLKNLVAIVGLNARTMLQLLRVLLAPSSAGRNR